MIISSAFRRRTSVFRGALFRPRAFCTPAALPRYLFPNVSPNAPPNAPNIFPNAPPNGQGARVKQLFVFLNFKGFRAVSSAVYPPESPKKYPCKDRPERAEKKFSCFEVFVSQRARVFKPEFLPEFFRTYPQSRKPYFRKHDFSKARRNLPDRKKLFSERGNRRESRLKNYSIFSYFNYNITTLTHLSSKTFRLTKIIFTFRQNKNRYRLFAFLIDSSPPPFPLPLPPAAPVSFLPCRLFPHSPRFLRSFRSFLYAPALFLYSPHNPRSFVLPFLHPFRLSFYSLFFRSPPRGASRALFLFLSRSFLFLSVPFRSFPLRSSPFLSVPFQPKQ